MKPGQKLAINWPLAWYRSHNTAKRLLDEGRIGDLIEVHYYDGNRGPLYHVADKVDGERRGRREAEARRAGSTRRPRAAAASSTISAMARRWAPGSTAAPSRSR